MNPAPPLSADCEITQRFSNAAGNYHNHARVQKQICKHLWKFAQSELPLGYQPQACIDVGSGTGFLTEHLLEKYNCPVHAIDIAPGMADWLRERISSPRLQVHVTNGEYLSSQGGWPPKLSLLASNMCVQWFSNLEQALTKWLTVSSHVAFSVLLQGSFEAWRQAHISTGQSAGLHPLPAYSDLQAMISRFTEQGMVQRSKMSQKEFLDHHFDGLSFARSLRAIGADAPKANHKPANLRAVISELGTGCTMNYRVAFIYLEGT